MIKKMINSQVVIKKKVKTRILKSLRALKQIKKVRRNKSRNLTTIGREKRLRF